MRAEAASGLLVAVILSATSVMNAEWGIEAIAGGGPDNLPALEANLAAPVAVAFGSDGELLILARESAQLLRVDSSGILHRIVQGDYIDVLSGVLRDPADVAATPDGRIVISEPRRGIKIWEPSTGTFEVIDASSRQYQAVTVDSTGRIYFSQRAESPPRSSVVRRYDPADGSITAVAGKEDCPSFPIPFCIFSSAEGAPALEVRLASASGLAIDGAGDLYIADGNRVRRVDADGRIWTVAGSTSSGDSGDGGPALEARLLAPADVVIDAAGNLLIADSGNDRVRRVDATTGIITTIAGNGEAGYAGDGGPAIEARLDAPNGLALDAVGNLLVADYSNLRVRRVDAGTGNISTVAGNGALSFSGDGYLATGASFANDFGVSGGFAVDADGNLWITDTNNHRVRRVDAETGIVTTVAGNGESTYDVEDDGLPASQAVTPIPKSPVLDPNGNLYFVTQENRLRRIDGGTGVISTIPVSLRSIAFDRAGNMYAGGSRHIVAVNPATGEFQIIAGNGSSQYNGENLPALETALYLPFNILFDDQGDLVFTDLEVTSPRIRRISARTGLVETIAGGVGRVPPQPIEGKSLPALGFVAPGRTTGIDSAGGVWITGFDWWDPLVARYDPDTGVITKVIGPDYAPPGTPPSTDSDIERLVPRHADVGSDDAVYVSSGGIYYRATNANEAPVAIASGATVLPCTGAAGASVVLDGSLSYDPDDEPGGDSEIAAYQWFVDYGDPEARLIAKGSTVEVELSIGRHEITLLVRDASGRKDKDEIEIDVRDDQDVDGDGLATCADNCPAVYNPDPIDFDGNGLGDACDPCFSALSSDADADTVCDSADNCLTTPNPDQADRDGDSIGDACDACPELSNTDQAERATCLQVSETPRVCRTITTNTGDSESKGRIMLAGLERPAPQRIEFDVVHAQSPSPDLFEFRLNGGTIASGLRPTSPLYSFTGFSVDDAALIESLWRDGQTNEIAVAKSGTNVPVSLVLVRLIAGLQRVEQCLYDPDEDGVCGAPQTTQEIEGSVSIQAPFITKIPLSDRLYGPDPPTVTFDVSSEPFPEYRLCISATRPDGARSLVASTESGELLEIDPFSATIERRGILPMSASDVAYDVTSGAAVGASPSGYVTRFDVRDGARDGPLAWTASPPYFADLEYVEGSLLAGPLQVDPDTGASMASPFDFSGHGLAFHEAERSLWGLQQYPCQHCSLSILARFDLATNEETYLTASGELSNMQFGPDGLLYGVDLPWESTSRLFVIDHEAGASIPIGDTGVRITGLTLDGSQGAVDCANFDWLGEERLAINASCGPPTAVIAPVGDTACTSEAGGAVILDGTATTDPNSDPGQEAGDLTYDWYEDYGAATEHHLGSSAVLEAVLAPGVHAITLRVTNRFGEAATAATTASVYDDEAPTVMVNATPGALWPPNHRMVDVTIAIEAQDDCGVPEVRLVDVTSSEPDDAPGGGDGHTTGDIEGAELTTADTSIGLRAERAGGGAGRVYTLVYEAVDSAGLSARSTARVVVPHSHDGSSEPLRLSLESTEGGTLARWTEVPGALYYDVIRGHLGALRISGDAVDLGPVVCLEAGSLDITTAGYEDAAVPDAGEAFTYLVEYHDGWQPTSYGTESAARPRQVPQGTCH